MLADAVTLPKLWIVPTVNKILEIEMENDIALITSGFLALRIGIMALFAYAIYRVLRPSPRTVPIETQSHFATERYRAVRPRR